MLQRIALISPALALILLLPFAKATATDRQYHRILESFPLNLDLSVVEDAHSIHLLLQTAEGLLTFEKSSIAPAIAHRWEVSANQKDYSFYLSPDAKFSNGSKITSSDVIKSFEYVLRNGTNWKDLSVIKGADLFRLGKSKRVQGLIKVSDEILKISLNKPFPPFLEILAASPFSILPLESLYKLKAFKVTPFVSSGPYVIKEVTPSQIRLIKNYYYPNAKDIYFDSILYTVVTSEKEAREGFLKGIYDDIWPYRADPVPASLKDDLTEISALAAFTWYLKFNLKRKEVLDPGFRKFIANNLELDGFLKTAGFPSHFKATGIIPRGLVGYRTTTFEWPKITPKEGLKHCSRQRPCTIEVLYSHEFTTALETLFNPLIQDQPKLKIVLIKLDRNKWYKRLQEGRYSLIFMAATSGYFDSYMLLSYLLDDPSLPEKDHRKVMSLLDKAATTPSKGERAQIYQSIDEELLNEAGVIPIFHGDRPTLQVRKKFKGYFISILGFPYQKMMHISEVESAQ